LPVVVAGPNAGDLTRALGGAAVDGCLDQGEDGALQGGREQDFPPFSLRVGGLRCLIFPATAFQILLRIVPARTPLSTLSRMLNGLYGTLIIAGSTTRPLRRR
jgi:hypothetical protein